MTTDGGKGVLRKKFFTVTQDNKGVVNCSFRSSVKARSMAQAAVKRVLILGAGYVSGPVVDYLTRDKNVHVTVGK